MMSLDIYTAATPNGWKISIMIEELKEAGIDLPEIKLHRIDLSKGGQFSKEFTDICPNQKIPALVHDGKALMESCAILHYLGETFPTALFPQGEDRWQVIQWLYWQAANVGPIFGNKLSYTRYIADATDEQKKHPIQRFGTEALRLVAVLDRQLELHDYVCGDSFTIADISIWCWIRSWKWAKVDITGKPRVLEWVRRVRARPGVERGISFGVPKEEIDQFSEERKAQYRKSGASIASNDRLPSDI